jgi:hypothetical protein
VTDMGTSEMGVGRGRLSSMVVLGVVGGVVNLQASWLWWKKEATTLHLVTLLIFTHKITCRCSRVVYLSYLVWPCFRRMLLPTRHPNTLARIHPIHAYF